MKKLFITLGVIALIVPILALALTPQFQYDPGGTLTTSLVSYWNMEGNSNDYWGTNNGTDTNVSYNSSYGKVNEGMNLATASKGYSSIASNSTMDISGAAFSIAFWINFHSLPASTQVTRFLMKGALNGGTGWAFGYTQGSGLDLTKQGIANQAVAWSPSINTWYFIVAVQNFSAGHPTNVTYYVNGSSIGSYSDTSGYTSSAGSTAYIGNDISYGGSINSDEYLDEMGLWSKALSTTEISDLYNGGAGQTMCNGTGGPACSSGRRKIITVSFNWKPEHFTFA